jgi:L-fuconolactonase|uniref:amidohydrolase family protein n=1 Tax=Cephaloticoccus sp. TaxID=1985742 RepID=UPI00404A0D79
MPSFPIVDTHLHIWNLQRLNYPWLAGVPMLNRDHLIGEYRKVCGPVQVAKMVFLQCECDQSQYQDEADWVTEVSLLDPRIRGIVPWAPLEKGDAAEEDLARLAANPMIKGIRRIIQFEADPEFCLRPDFVKGVQLLAKFGFTFDICINHKQMTNTLKLVRQCPDVSFVMDHHAKPDVKNHLLDPWREQMRELASLPNTSCKLSGLVTEADFEHWTIDDLRPYTDHVVECFGFNRLFFGGDWPVASQATEYPRWVDTLDEILKGCSPDELHKVYVRNAEAFYRV